MSREDRSSQVVAASVFGIVFSTLAIVVRLWSRRVVNDALFWWDDYLAVLGWVFALGDCALSLHWTHVGLGQSGLLNNPALQLPKFVQHFLYNIGITMIKMSLICFYARVFRNQSYLRIGLWIVATMCAAWYVAATVVSVGTCWPVERQWNIDAQGSCANTRGAYLGLAVTNILVDLIILVLPVYAVWQLKMSKARRLGVTSVFAMGCCIVHTAEVAHFQNIESRNRDFAWNWTLPQALLVVEMPLGIFGICLPCILLLARRCYKFGWQSVLISDGTGQYRASPSLPDLHAKDIKSGGDDSHRSVAQFFTTLGHRNGTVISTHASRDLSEEAQLFGTEEIQVRVDIDVDFDSLPSKPESASTVA